MENIKSFSGKINQIKTLIENDKNVYFDLFCVVELNEIQNQFDIIVSANWLPKSEMESIGLIRDYIHNNFQQKDLMNISSVVILKDNEPFYKEVKQMKSKSYENIKICDMPIKRLSIL